MKNKLQKILSGNFEKKKLLIVGFYGAPNLGDELMLETLLSYLEDFSHLDITVMLCRNPKYDIKKYGAIKFIQYPRKLLEFNTIADTYDVVIFGGGAILDDNFYNPDDLNFDDMGTIFIELSSRVLAFKKKLLCIGLSSNEVLYNSEFISNLKYIVENSDYFSLRDEDSFKLLVSLGIDSNKMKRINDIVLAHRGLIKEYEFKKMKTINVGLILICDENTYKNFSLIVGSVVEAMKIKGRKNFVINLIPFYGHNKNDSYFCDKFIEESEYKDKLKVISLPEKMEELITLFNQQDLIISMRYHASLIALMLQRPTLTIRFDTHTHYKNKMNTMKNIFHGQIIDYSKLNKEDLVLQVNKLRSSKRKRIDVKNLFKETEREIKSLLKNYLRN